MNISNTAHSALATNNLNQQAPVAPKNAPSTQDAQDAKRAEQAKAQQQEANKAREAENRANETRVTLSQQAQPEPNTANRNAKPIESYKAVSALRS